MAIDKLKSGALNLQDDVAVDTDTLFVDVSTDRVGIGTSSPSTDLDVTTSGGQVNVDSNGHITSKQFLDAITAGGRIIGKTNRGIVSQIDLAQTAAGADGGYISFLTCNVGSTSPTERMRLLAGGGLTFNGDTAAANALDDYEEGTWTPTVSNHTGSTSGQAVGGVYVKVGKICHFQGVLTQGSGSVIGIMTLGGFPFTSAGSYGHISINTSANNQIQMSACRVVAGQTAFSIKEFDGDDVSGGSGGVNICFQGSFQVV